MNLLKRQARIKAINAACGKLGIGADERHALQRQIAGKASLTEMTLAELDAVLSHVNRIAAPSSTATPLPRPLSREGRGEATPEWRFVFRLAADRQPAAKKIYRLAERVGALLDPPVPVASKAYIEGIAKQMRGCQQPLEFCDAAQLHQIVQALEVFCKRHEPTGAVL